MRRPTQSFAGAHLRIRDREGGFTLDSTDRADAPHSEVSSDAPTLGRGTNSLVFLPAIPTFRRRRPMDLSMASVASSTECHAVANHCPASICAGHYMVRVGIVYSDFSTTSGAAFTLAVDHLLPLLPREGLLRVKFGIGDRLPRVGGTRHRANVSIGNALRRSNIPLCIPRRCQVFRSLWGRMRRLSRRASVGCRSVCIRGPFDPRIVVGVCVAPRSGPPSPPSRNERRRCSEHPTERLANGGCIPAFNRRFGGCDLFLHRPGRAKNGVPLLEGRDHAAPVIGRLNGFCVLLDCFNGPF
jgi:hypothetical protein